MHFDLAAIPVDLAAIPAGDAYKLRVSTVVSRPIALATAGDAAGPIDAAPFSLFDAVRSAPPVVVLGISPGDPASGLGGGCKDTVRNIRDTGEFVVNLVDEEIAERMHRPGRYARTSDLSPMNRTTFAEWQDGER